MDFVTTVVSGPITAPENNATYVSKDGVITSNGVGINAATNLQYIIDMNGEIASASSGINVGLVPDDDNLATVRVGETGLIMSGGASGITMIRTDSWIDNAGDVHGAVGGVAYAPGVEYAYLTNAGTLAGNESGVIFYGDSGSPTNTDLVVQNDGTIRGYTVFGIFVGDGNLELQNNGTITGLGFSANVDMGDGTDHLENHGEIVGRVTFGTGSTGDFLYNTGTISMGVNTTPAIFFDETSDYFLNDGMVIGEVGMGDGDDVYEGTGTILGLMNMDTGDDTAKIRGGSVVVDGGSGTDVGKMWTDVERVLNVEQVIMRGGDDIALMEAVGDTYVRGNAGDNYVFGGSGNDVILLREGNDTADGDSDDDVIRGQGGNDDIAGGAGNDELYGGRGDDRIEGGEGTDILTDGDGTTDAELILRGITDFDADALVL